MGNGAWGEQGSEAQRGNQPPSPAADGRDDCHLVPCPQRLLLPWCQVLLVEAEHEGAAQLGQLRELQAAAG